MSPQDLKKGTIFKYKDEPFQVLSYSHSHMARGGSTIRVKARGLVSSNVFDVSFKGGDTVDNADLSRSKADYLYKDNDNAYFMDQQSYEQFSLSIPSLSNQIGYLKESAAVDVLIFEGNPVAITLPVKMEFKVKYTEPAVKGDTAQGSITKPAELETGLSVPVPIFVKTGDVIRINTEKGEYVERVS